MLIKQKIGSLKDIVPGNRQIETIALQWYETAKKILHKKTDAGREIIMKLFSETERLGQGDVMYADEDTIICINIIPVKAIVLKPATLKEMAWLCYEIGNKHLPLFYDEEELSMPYEDPVFNMLVVAGYNPMIENRKLLLQLKTSVAPHGQGNSIPLGSKNSQFIKAKDES